MMSSENDCSGDNKPSNFTAANFEENPNSFNSFIGDQNNGDGDASTSASSSTSSDYLKISVRDPKTEGDHVTYLITTWTSICAFNGTEFSVRRRFKDVVMLSDRLSESYRGFFIPTRPDKNSVEKKIMQKYEFVEQRRFDLEKYLRKLAAHPVLRNSVEFRMFLQVQGNLPWTKTTNVGTTGVRRSEIVDQGKGGGDLVKMFKELRQSVTYGWGATKPPLVEEDKEFLEKKTKLQKFEVQLSNVCLQAESLVKAQQDIGETMGELGLAFVKLTKFEEAVFISQKTRAEDMKNAATSAVKASRLYRELNAQTIKHLDKLHDNLGVMLDVNNAYTDRSNALLTLQTLVSEVSTLNARIEKLEAVAFRVFGADRSTIQRIDELKETMRVAEDAKKCAVKEYEHIKEHNKTEFVRIDKQRCEDFVGMLKGFAVNQAGYAVKMASVWETFANKTSRYAQN